MEKNMAAVTTQFDYIKDDMDGGKVGKVYPDIMKQKTGFESCIPSSCEVLAADCKSDSDDNIYL